MTIHRAAIGLKLLIWTVAGFQVVPVLSASEIWVVRFSTFLDSPSQGCPPLVSWFSLTAFHNSTDTTQAVQFLGVSNGDPQPSPKPLSLPPHKTVSLLGNSGDWAPVQREILWVNRLDVPTGVIVANHLESGVIRLSAPPCNGHTQRYAGLPLPVVSALTPAGTSRYFLGTDVGADTDIHEVTDSRLNVGVYNGGTVPGNATVNIYCSYFFNEPLSPDTLLQTDQFQVPANSVVQKTVLASTQAAKCPTGSESYWYAIVTVDQPSFAYAIGMANGALPTFPGVVALSSAGN